MAIQLPNEKASKGQESGNFFVSTEGSHKEIADIDSVAFHVVSGNRQDVDRVWGMNIIVAKHYDTQQSYVVGFEASMVNDTADDLDVIGVLSSYVGHIGGGNAAFESTGNIAGWNNGMVISAIKPTGKGIVFNDNIPSIFGGVNHEGMAIGIDFSRVSKYTYGAMLLGNNHAIFAKNSVGGAYPIMKLIGNTLIFGVDLGVANDGYTIIRSTGQAVVLQDKTGATKFQVGLDALNPISAFVNGAMKKVEVGEVDSGGSGYRILRVSN